MKFLWEKEERSNQENKLEVYIWAISKFSLLNSIK